MSKKTWKKLRAMKRDSFSNPIARLGLGTQDLMQGTMYQRTLMTENYQLLNNLYRGNWIVQNVINTIPDDMMRSWIEIHTENEDDEAKVRKCIRRNQVIDKLRKGMYWGRLYGGAIGLIVLKGDMAPEEPIDIDSILPDDFKGIRLFDRWTGVTPSIEIEDDIESRNFGLPKYYDITNMVDGHTLLRVHNSKIIRFIGRELPYIEKVNTLYWGESELEAIYNEIVNRDNVSQNMASLTFKANRDYQETDSLDQMLAFNNLQAQRQFWNTLQAQSVLESNFGIRLINKGDVLHNQQYSFTGLPEVYDRMMMNIAGASRTPVTKLFGRSPAGMNATGESDLKNYYDYIDSLRESQLRPILDDLLKIIFKSATGNVPEFDFDFPSLHQDTETEKSDIKQKSIQSIIQLYSMGLIDKNVALKELKDAGITSITTEMIEGSKGMSYEMQDPFANLNTNENIEVK